MNDNLEIVGNLFNCLLRFFQGVDLYFSLSSEFFFPPEEGRAHISQLGTYWFRLYAIVGSNATIHSGKAIHLYLTEF